MIRSKYFGLAAVAFAMLSLGACTTDSNDNNLAISGNPRLDNSTLTAGGAAVSIRGTITNDAGNISYTLKVQNSTTGADATSSFVLAYKAPTTSETSWSIGDPAQGAGTITALASAATGSYNLVITATSGTATTSATVPFTVTGGSSAASTLATVNTLNVAAQGVTGVNSFISVGNAVSYSGTETKTKFTSTDLVVTYDAVDTTQTNFESTAAAVLDGSFTLTYWGAGRATLIKDVGTTEPVSLATAQALIGTAQTAAIVNGHYYVVKTVEGVYAVLYASSVSGTGNSMTLTVKILN